MHSSYKISSAILLILASAALAVNIVPKKDTPTEVVIHATNKTSTPSVHYVVDAVECLKQAYAVYADDQSRVELYSALFEEKHPETKWNVVVGYTAAHINSQWYVETSVSSGGKGKSSKGDKEEKERFFLIFSVA